MNKSFLPILASMAVCGLVACDREVVVPEKTPATPIPEPVAETKTLETSRLGAAVDDFGRHPTSANSAEVKKTMARLDEEIAELEKYIAEHDGDARAKAAGKLENMKKYRAEETARFTALQAKSAVGDGKSPDTRTGAEKAEDTTRKVGEGIQEGVRKAGEAVKDVVH